MPMIGFGGFSMTPVVQVAQMSYRYDVNSTTTCRVGGISRRYTVLFFELVNEFLTG